MAFLARITRKSRRICEGALPGIPAVRRFVQELEKCLLRNAQPEGCEYCRKLKVDFLNGLACTPSGFLMLDWHERLTNSSQKL